MVSSPPPNPSSSSMEKIHPAIMVTNIRNFIPIILEMENDPYTSWVELFKIHCRAFQVLDHILPTASTFEAADDTSWQRLDAIVLQWIYGTISNDLLHTILKPDSTAAQAWQSLANVFQDNQTSRALYLEHKFSNTRLSDYANVSAYCQALKVLADQLANVNAPVSNQRLVLQLIAGLTEQFDGVAMLLQQITPLPDFTIARSKLILEETRKANQVKTTGTALHANTTVGTTTTPNHSPKTASTATPHPPTQPLDYSVRGYFDASYSQPRPGYSPRGRGRGGCGRGRGRSRGRGHYQYYSPWLAPRQPYYPSPPPWHTPPCPNPTTPTYPLHSRSPGILGAAPPQSYASSECSYTPTNIDQAMHTMTLNPDQQWYLDSGTTNHMSNTTGNLSNYVYNSILNSIVVGNGFHIPILGTGQTTLPPPYPPLKLTNILHAPKLIKNLLSVRKLTTDNRISIEFDAFGFLVKDFQTRIPILRCDSTGDPYPLSSILCHCRLFKSRVLLHSPPSPKIFRTVV